MKVGWLHSNCLLSPMMMRILAHLAIKPTQMGCPEVQGELWDSASSTSKEHVEPDEAATAEISNS